MRRSWLLALWFSLGSVAPAFAHEMSMAEIELRELSQGQFVLSWGASGNDRPLEQDLTPEWPEG